jgi:hypothetical protein
MATRKPIQTLSSSLRRRTGVSYLIDVVGQDTEYTVFTRNSFRTVKIFNDEMLLHESLKAGGGLGANKPLLIMEAMKMENEMRTSADVKIKQICVKQGDSIEAGAVLIKFEAPP